MERALVDQTWVDRPDTYNLILGGGGGPGERRGHPVSEETRKRLSARFSGAGNPMFGRPSPTLGKHHTAEAKRKISERKLGHEVSEETRSKISKSKKGQLAGIKLSA